MRRMMSFILACILLLCSCANVESNTDAIQYSPSDIDEKNYESDAEMIELVSNGTEKQDDNGLGVTIKGLDDENLIAYVENNVYSKLVNELNSEDFFVENVEAVYYPKEYIEALASNANDNLYFGYTSAELDKEFQGTKYVFTLGEDGRTIVVPMETLTDDVYVKAMEDVIVGSGVILVCVTVSTLAAPAAPAVSMIFAASATTGTSFALQSGTLSFAAAAIAKGYETESFDQALRAGVEAAGEGFKWGAIIGGATGGIKTAVALKGATLNGLTMNEAAKIQKESGYPLELIKQFKSVKEYEVYKEAGLYTKMVNGKIALVRDIDLNYVTEMQDGTKLTNLQLMQRGKAPIDPATGKTYQLHHINQEKDSVLAILKESEHQGQTSILHDYAKQGVHNAETGDKLWPKKREAFWKAYAKLFG